MIPAIVRSALSPVVRRLNELDAEIGQSDQAILALAKADATAIRLNQASVPSPPLRLLRAFRISLPSRVRVSLPPSLGLRLDKAHQVARSGWGVFPKWATDICVNCLL